MPKLTKFDSKALDRYLYFVRERESVRLKKEAGEPKPWTEDKILQSYRFCNMRRMDDKVSQWLLKYFYEPHYNHPNMLVAVALARFFNKPESLAHVQSYLFGDKYQPEAIKRTMRRLRDAGMVIWNNAYMVRGNDGMDKIECVVDYYVKPLLKIQSGLPTYSMKAAWEKVKDSYGFGSFMAGQIVADMRWAVDGRWEDRNTWAPIGPGSKRGMNRLIGRDLKFNLSQEQFDVELRELMNVIVQSQRVQPELLERMEAIDHQNTLCEADKYFRVLNGEGKPKQLYQGV